MAEFENPFADPEAQNLFHVSCYDQLVSYVLVWSCDGVSFAQILGLQFVVFNVFRTVT